MCLINFVKSIGQKLFVCGYERRQKDLTRGCCWIVGTCPARNKAFPACQVLLARPFSLAVLAFKPKTTAPGSCVRGRCVFRVCQQGRASATQSAYHHDTARVVVQGWPGSGISIISWVYIPIFGRIPIFFFGLGKMSLYSKYR